jgi:hypothetical protein
MDMGATAVEVIELSERRQMVDERTRIEHKTEGETEEFAKGKDKGQSQERQKLRQTKCKQSRQIHSREKFIAREGREVELDNGYVANNDCDRLTGKKPRLDRTESNAKLAVIGIGEGRRYCDDEALFHREIQALEAELITGTWYQSTMRVF